MYQEKTINEAILFTGVSDCKLSSPLLMSVHSIRRHLAGGSYGTDKDNHF